MLRAMEQPSISHLRAWRAAAAAVKHAWRAAPHRQGLAASPQPADVVAVLDAPTPSNVGTLGSLLDAAAEAGLSCHVVCSTKEERAALLRVKPAAEASLLDDWAVPRTAQHDSGLPHARRPCGDRFREAPDEGRRPPPGCPAAADR